jgi:hypothetical protein
MKKKFIIGVINIILVIGFVMTGCDLSFLDDSSGGSSSSGSSNLFAGTSWRATDGGYTMNLSFTSSSWTLRSSDGESKSGSYTYSGYTATCRQGTETIFTATISGNTLNAVDYDGYRLTFTKGSTGTSDDSSTNNNSSPGDSSGSADGEIPTKPKNFKVIPDTESTMILEWSKGSYDDDVTGYNIYRSIESSSSGFTELATVTSRTFTDTGLSPNTRYYYYVTAYNECGESRASDSNGNMTAVLAGTTRDTATELKFEGYTETIPRIYYFPPDADELWFYFYNPDPNKPEYHASVWDSTWDGNYFTAGFLDSKAYWDNDDTTRGGGKFGIFTSNWDLLRGDGRISISISGCINKISGSVIYFKVYTNTKGTFSMLISY